MFRISSNYHCLTVVTVFLIQGWTCTGVDFGKIFGNNVNQEEAWSRLFKLENCPTSQRLTSTIIMVNESLNAGAKFLEHPNATSQYECEFYCCMKNSKCNVAVYNADKVSNQLVFLWVFFYFIIIIIK